MSRHFDNYKFHPSSLGKVMTGSRTKDPFGETAKKHLMQCYVESIYGRTTDVTNKYLEKGVMAEEDSLTLYSRVKKEVFIKNKDVIENDFLIGTPDIISPPFVIDIKTSWDIFTFHNVIPSALNKEYWWQLQGYMDLTEADHAKLVYCLVDTPLKLIQDEQKKLAWRLGVIDEQEDELYWAGCEEIEKNMTFEDIPIHERYIEFTIDRDQEAIDSAHEKIELCREFLNAMFEARSDKVLTK